MNRLYLKLLAVLTPLVCISCDRRTTAELILTIGAASLSQPAAACKETKASGSVTADVQTVQRIEGLLLTCGELHADLRRLRNPSRQTSTPAEPARMRSRVDTVNEVSQGLAFELQEQPGLVSQVREVELAALALAARQDPAIYLLQRDSFCRTTLGHGYDESNLARISTQRFVGDHLASGDTDADAVIALTLHALAYPNCDANVVLYITVVDRLVSQGDTAVADLLGKSGLLLLQARPEVGLLQERLAAIHGLDDNSGDMTAAKNAQNRNGCWR